MTFILGLILGAVLGYTGAYLQHNPDDRAALLALFKRKPKP